MSTAAEDPAPKHASRFRLPRRLKTLAVLPTGLKLHPQDLTASLSGAIAGVPDAMAGGVMAGVSPINGLYAGIVAPIIGGLTARTPLLVVSTTSASALAAAEVTRQYDGADRLQALLLLTFLAGLIQVAVSLIHPVKITSFVSHSVMTGFLIGIATLVVLGQLGNFVGYDPSGGNAVTKTADVAVNLSQADSASVAIGVLTLVLVYLATRVHLSSVSALVALAITSALVALLSLDQVATVADIADIPTGFPLPSLPDFSFFSVPFALSALALGAITFVQTVGVSQGLPGDNTPRDPDGDIRASGLANVGVSLFQGQPVGGSMGQSALNVQAGAKGRVASVLIGVWMLIIVLLLSPLVEIVPMPSLAALLMIAGVAAIKVSEAKSIWATGWGSRLTITTTFLLTLLLPIQYAVLAGVALSVVLYLMSSSEDVHVRQLQLVDGGMLETEAPETLESGSAVVLDVYGSLFYAGARTLERRLPAVSDAVQAIVILRLRGRTSVGATAVEVLTTYAAALRRNQGRLYLAGLDAKLEEQLRRNGKLRLMGVRLYPAFNFIGRSVSQSYDEAQAWLAANRVHEVA